jgi:hypothetical protein
MVAVRRRYELAKMIEACANELKNQRITFVPYDQERLSEELKKLPEIVDDFFGRECRSRLAAQKQTSRMDPSIFRAVLSARGRFAQRA